MDLEIINPDLERLDRVENTANNGSETLNEEEQHSQFMAVGSSANSVENNCIDLKKEHESEADANSLENNCIDFKKEPESEADANSLENKYYVVIKTEITPSDDEGYMNNTLIGNEPTNGDTTHSVSKIVKQKQKKKYKRKKPDHLFMCPRLNCGKKFTEKNKCKKHVEIVHLGIRIFLCEICSKAFGKKSQLDRHIYSLHTEIEDKTEYQCAICAKVFYDQRKLDHHKTLHTGEKEFICTVEGCGKAFR